MPVKRDFSNYFQEIQTAAAPAASTRKSYAVENAFKPVYKDGKFSVVLRFLPSHPSEFKPFIENRSHMFKLDNGSWFGCDCLGKFGKPCPICEYNREMFKKYGKEEGRNRSLGKARNKYVSNVLIIRNPNAPDTEGQVFRFEYGAQIMKMISEAMTDHDDLNDGLIKGFNPFDWKTGANFVYEGVQSSNGPKLDSSHFGPQKAICKWNGKSYEELSDAEIDAVEAQLYTLEDCYHKEEDVADYAQILERYEKKTGKSLFEGTTLGGASVASVNPFASAPAATKAAVEDSFDFGSDEPAAPAPKAAAQATMTSTDEFFASLG